MGLWRLYAKVDTEINEGLETSGWLEENKNRRARKGEGEKFRVNEIYCQPIT